MIGSTREFGRAAERRRTSNSASTSFEEKPLWAPSKGEKGEAVRLIGGYDCLGCAGNQLILPMSVGLEH
jgi:hypothetical protein